MRIAVVCPYDIARPGGVQQQVREIARGARAHGHDAWIVAPSSRDEPGVRRVGRPVAIAANGSVAPVAVDPRVTRAVRHAVADADVVHVHEPFMPLVSLGALAAAEPPVVGTFHADPPARVRAFYRRSAALLHRVAARMVAVTAVSPIAAEAIAPFVDGARIVPNGIETRRFASDGPRVRNQVAFLGRDEPRKGLDVLLAAWPGVVSTVPEARLVVMGSERDGGLRGVQALGLVDDERKRSVLGASGIYVAPNRGGESFGITVLEAMASGCAVVASALPAFRFVLDGAGMFVPVGEPDALAGALVGLLRDHADQARLGATARRRAAAFDWDVVLPMYLDVLEEAAGSTPAKG